MRAKSFKLVARIGSKSPQKIKPVLHKLIGKGTIRQEGADFFVDGELEGTSSRDLNRVLLSGLRRVERKTALHAEWTCGKKTEKFFDYRPLASKKVE
jgi:hypothetical protein